MKKVLVAMSGGTDSSAVCMMLLEQGYEVQGLTMRMWDTPAKFNIFHQEQPDYIIDAQTLAAKLGFQHHILDMREPFRKCVIGDFIDEYLAGRTPNPCVQCNIHIKTKYLLQKADELGSDYIATGHYANIVDENGIFYLEKGFDTQKDQSYFLWGLPQDVLKRMLFPLGKFTKNDARTEARKFGFENIATKTESQDICFIDDDYRNFLQAQIPDLDKKIGPGNFLDTNGKIIGKHKGFPFYTIGQRKGLEIALGAPMYVLDLNSRTNEITIGAKENLQIIDMKLCNCNFPAPELISPNEELQVRIRYKSQAVNAFVTSCVGNCATVHFSSPIEAVTPGQSAVIYRNNRVLGGGIIC